MRQHLSHFAHLIAFKLASAWSYVAGATLILVWAISGPFFRYSPKWQFVMTAGISIATFLLVLILQHTEFRQTKALQLSSMNCYALSSAPELIWCISKTCPKRRSSTWTKNSSTCRRRPRKDIHPLQIECEPSASRPPLCPPKSKRSCIREHFGDTEKA